MDSIHLGVKEWRFKRSTMDMLAVFLVNPFLALPYTLLGVYNKHRSALFFLAVIFGVVSFLYVPNVSNDKAMYVYYHVLFQKSSFTFESFIGYMQNGRPDFLLLLLTFIFAKLGLSFGFVAMIATTITVSIFFYVFDQIAQDGQLTRSTYFLAFLLIFFGISLSTLLSGIRFYLAFSISLLGFWYGLKDKRHLRAMLLFGVAAITHFSSSLYIPVYIICSLLWRQNYLLTVFFFLSFAFVLLPKEILYGALSAMGLPASYQAKADVYMAGEDVLASQGGGQSIVAQSVNIIKSLWIVVGVLFVAFKVKRISQLKSLTMIFWSIGNLVYSVPTVYNRLMIIPKMLLSLWIIQELGYKENRKWLYALSFFWLIGFVAEVMIMRNNIIPSYFTMYSVSFFSIFFKNITPSDFLR